MEGFPGPFRAVVKGARTWAAERRKRWINHTKESLKSCRFIHGRKKITDGGGVLRQRMKAQELRHRHGKLALAQANRQAMDTAQLQDVTEMLNMRG